MDGIAPSESLADLEEQLNRSAVVTELGTLVGFHADGASTALRIQVQTARHIGAVGRCAQSGRDFTDQGFAESA